MSYRSSNAPLYPKRQQRPSARRPSFGTEQRRPSSRAQPESDSSDDTDEDTKEGAQLVASDVSQQPVPKLRARASFSRNPVADTLEFDKDLPPDSIEETLEDRQRTRALADRRPSTSAAPSRVDSFVQMAARPVAKTSNATSSAPPRFANTTSAVPARSLPAAATTGFTQYRAPQRHFDQSSDDDGGSDDDSDEDAFTAVGTGVATDLELLDDDMPPASFPIQPRQPSPLQGMMARHNVPSSMPMPPSVKSVANPPPATARQQIAQPAAEAPNSTGVTAYKGPPRPTGNAPPEDTPEEKALIKLLAEMNFSAALKDFHDILGIGVQKTIVAADGRGNAYVKVHCKKLPRERDLDKEAYLKQYWIAIGGTRWEVTIVWKTAALAQYEMQSRMA